MYKFKNIKSRLTFWFLIIAILPLILVDIIIYGHMATSRKVAIFNKLEAVRDLKVKELNNWLDERTGDIRTIVSDIEIRKMGKIHEGREEDIEKNMLIVTDARNFLRRYLQNYNSFSEMQIISPHTKTILVCTDEGHEGESRREEPYFSGELQHGQVYIRDIYFSGREDRPSMAFYSPIFGEGDREDHIFGVVVARINLEASLYDILLNRTGMGKTGETLIVNSDVIALNELRWHENAPLNLKIKAYPAVEASRGNTGIVETEDYRGEMVLAAYTHIPRTGWGFVAKQDLKEVYAPIYKLRQWTLFIGLLAIIGVIIAAFRIAKSISDPIKLLHKGTEMISSGNLEYKVGIDLNDEIGQLSRRFDHMIENLKIVTASRDELNREIDERKKVEKDLEKYKILISQINDLAYICDNHGNVLFLNDAFEKLTNHKPEEFIGKSFAPLFDDENLSKATEGYLRTLNGESPQFEVCFKETGIICEYKDIPLRDEKGNIIGVLGIARDITEHIKVAEKLKKAKDELEVRVKERTAELELTVKNLHVQIAERKTAEEKLEKEKEKLQKYLDISAVMVVMINADQKVILINKKGCDILGCETEEIIGTNWFDNYLPERMRDGARNIFDKLMAGEIEPAEYDENEVLTKNGEERLIAWYNTIFRDEKGNILATLASGADITERNKNARALQQSYEVFTTVLDSFDGIVYVADMKTYEILYVNKYLRDIFGDLKGKVCWQTLQTDQTAPCSFCTNDKLLTADGKPAGVYNWEFQNTVNGKWYDIRDRAIEWIDGRVVRLEIAVDITDRKKVEEKIKASLKEKEVLIREVHHRVKNNMAVISSLLKLQAGKVPEGKYREMFNDSMGRIKSMSLVHEKLYRSEDIADIDFGSYLKEVVTGIFSSYRLIPGRVSLNIEVENISIGIDDAVPLGLLINELVSNSLKHGFPGGREGQLRVVLRRIPQSSLIELIVNDNGVGIPEGLDFRKTGSLGLTLVSTLTRQLHGEIEIRREKGTEFRITFMERT